jgi:hypothetical protein
MSKNVERLESTALDTFAKYVPELDIKSFKGLDWFWRTILANQLHDTDEPPTPATYRMIQVRAG